jgi:putative chitinase
MGSEVQFFVHIGGSAYPVTKFAGSDAVSNPYHFDIDFQPDKPLGEEALNMPCALEIRRGGGVNRYGGVVGEVRTRESLETEDNGSPVRCSIRLVPRIYLLSMNFTTRIFKGLTVVEIIEKVIADAGLSEYFRFQLDKGRKWAPEEYCVQYQETDLNFISRLMERYGIWYYFEGAAAQPEWKERAVVTDKFSEFPTIKGELWFMKSEGQTGASESITSLSTKSALMPKHITTRAYNYRTPDNFPESRCELAGGQAGSVYEYGGAFKNLDVARRGAELHARRLIVENSRVDGVSNGVALRAGTLLSIVHPGDAARSGTYLIVSVNHAGGWDKKADSYKNEFSCVDAARQIYAPPLSAAPPFVGGLVTAPVDGLGDDSPTLDELGRYRVKLPYDISNSEDYCASKDIRLAQLSGGKGYGVHFPSKRGAEMVLAYVNGNPDKPLGLGFVPNTDAQSVVHSGNKFTNVVRSWGGGELLIDDSPGKQKVKLSSPKGRYMELHDGRKQAKLKSALSELLFSDYALQAILAAGGHSIHMNFLGDGFIALTTARKHRIEINDKEGAISLRSANGCEVLINDKGDSVTISDSAGKNKIVIDGAEEGALRLKSSGGVSIEAGGDIRIKAGSGIFVNGAEVKISSEKDGVEIKAATKLDMAAKNIAQEAAEKMETRGKEVKVEGRSKVGVKGRSVAISDGVVAPPKKAAAKEEKPKEAEKKPETVDKNETAASPPAVVFDEIAMENVMMAGESLINMINTKNAKTGNAKTEQKAAARDAADGDEQVPQEAEPEDAAAETGKKLITLEQLYEINGRKYRDKCEYYIDALNDVLPLYRINTDMRLAHFLAQTVHESGHLYYKEENLNYKAEGLRKTFGKYFTEAEFDRYARQPQKIANRVYANRMGNGGEGSGDGWKYRGRGLIQLTGRDNYKACGAALDMDFLNSPETLCQNAETIVRSACWYWTSRGLNEIADRDDVLSVTKKINGGTNGLENREENLRRAKKTLGC